MPDIMPFRALHYKPETMNHAEKVLCPPYDVISPLQQQELYDLSPCNAIRLELPMEPDPYGAAMERLLEWSRTGELLRDDEPAVYPCMQTFMDADGVTHNRTGFFCAMRLYDFAERKVLPHEKTLSGPKADRLNLFRKTKTNISPIFGLYADPDKSADRHIARFASDNPPMIDVVFQGVRNRMWKITDREIIEELRAGILHRTVFIADGHHRYETGLNYRNERAALNPHHTGNEACNFIMTFLTNIHDEGLIIFPIHRLLHSLEQFDAGEFRKNLEEYFTVTELPDRETLKRWLAEEPSSYTYGVVTPERLLGITLKESPLEVLDRSIPESLRNLGLVVLHELVLGKLLRITPEALSKQSNIRYIKDEAELYAAVENGTAQAGFVVKPTTVQQVVAVSESGEVMPQKSTFFYPKIMTGLVFNPLD
ncbi:MAG: DUF1015 domain-containing protein [Chlorobiaceae bacterium]|nr:DUF1015 domain-containing protein [Chlorobiaceae bacterium]